MNLLHAALVALGKGIGQIDPNFELRTEAVTLVAGILEAEAGNLSSKASPLLKFAAELGSGAAMAALRHGASLISDIHIKEGLKSADQAKIDSDQSDVAPDQAGSASDQEVTHSQE